MTNFLERRKKLWAIKFFPRVFKLNAFQSAF